MPITITRPANKTTGFNGANECDRTKIDFQTESCLACTAFVYSAIGEHI